jgi:transposase
MKTTFRIARVNPQTELLLAVDVSKDHLSYRAEVPHPADGQGRRVLRQLQGAVANRSQAIEELLRSMGRQATQSGYQHLRVVCEPTAGFERPLLRMAHSMGFLTSYVGGEQVNKAKVIDHNDTGKTDPSDTGVILTLASMGKVLTHHTLPPLYQQLRTLNRFCCSEDDIHVMLKCQLGFAIRQLFCDYSQKTATLYTQLGQAVMHAYRYNPHRIVRDGYQTFCATIRRTAPRAHEDNLRVLWKDALSSSRHQMSPEEQSLWEQHIAHRWELYAVHDKRSQALHEQMVATYQQLIDAAEPVPKPHKRYLNALRLATVIAETGPLTDYPTAQAVLKYAGLNLCMRQSGKWKGRTAISHKGNALLRKALGKAVLHLVRTGFCYAHYYQRKVHDHHMPGTKAMTAVMRKMLITIWVLGTRKVAYDEQRLFITQAEYTNAA